MPLPEMLPVRTVITDLVKPARPYTRLEEALLQAGAACLCTKPPRIVGDPDSGDCETVADHLENRLAPIVIGLLTAYRDELGTHFNRGDDVLSDLLDVLNDGFRDAIGHFRKLAESLREDEDERRTDPRGWDRAAERGVD
jgi:hypothetical protein